MTLRRRDLNRLVSYCSAAADVRTAITVLAKPAPCQVTALGSSESPILPMLFVEIFKPEEQPKLQLFTGTGVPGTSVA
jgi:hypothetical protein